jgi:kynureninase
MLGIPGDVRAWQAEARRQDGQDALAGFRSSFFLPPGLTNQDGSSLGLLSAPAEQAVLRLKGILDKRAYERYSAGRDYIS